MVRLAYGPGTGSVRLRFACVGGTEAVRKTAATAERRTPGPSLCAKEASGGRDRGPGGADELLTLFAAYTGLRAEELAGLEVRDLVFTQGAAGVRASVNVRRAKKRRAGQWVPDTLKSAKSARSVPLPPWLAERMADYLVQHPRAAEPTAPLWPNRALGGARRRGCRAIAPLDYTEPVDTELPSTRTSYAPRWKRLVYPPASRPRH